MTPGRAQMLANRRRTAGYVAACAVVWGLGLGLALLAKAVGA